MKKFILALFILYLPFQLKLLHIPVINTVNLFLFIVLLFLIFARDHKAVRARFDTPLLIFLIIWFLSFLHTVFFPRGIWTYAAAVEFKRLVTLVLAYFVFARCIKTKQELQFLFFVFITSVVLVGLHTWRNGMLAGMNFADFKRSSGPFGVSFRGADIAGGFLAIFSPFLLSVALLAKKKILKFFSLTGLIICLLGLFATYSRGSIFALGIGLIVTILAAIKPLFRQSKFSAVAMIALLICGTLGWRYWIPATIVNRMDKTTQGEVFVEDPYLVERVSADVSSLDQSSQNRIKTWKEGLGIFWSNPIYGAGFKIPQYALSYDTHNAYIQIAAEMGIFGILVFIWFLWGIFRQARSLIRTEFVVLGVGFIGCLTAFVFVNMFYSNFFRDTVVGTFWIILGIMAASKKYVIAQNE